MVLQIPSTNTEPTVTWEALPADYVLPDDPVENIQQPALAAALTDALGANERIQPEMLIVSNFGLVATVKKKIVVKAPDWLLCLPGETRGRRHHSPQLYPKFRRRTRCRGDGVFVSRRRR